MTHVRYLGHSFFLIAFKHANILVDPFVYSGSPEPQFKRMEKCPAREKDIPKIEFILVTQENFDHFDKKFIESIAKRDNASVVATQNVLNELSLPQSQLVPVESGQKRKLKGIDVTVMDAHFPTSFYPVSYHVSDGETSIYHAGASQDFSEHESLKADLLLLPIGGTISMDVVDAVKLTKTAKPKYAIPMHYNTFDFIKVDPREFSHRITKSILKTKPVILKPGETFHLD